jgi:hypothetical protein
MVNFVSAGNITNQSFFATPRYAGQIVRLNGVDTVATADEVPVRVQGTGTVYVSEGWWDRFMRAPLTYTGNWFSGSTPDTETERYSWNAAEEASFSTMETRYVTNVPYEPIWNVGEYSVVEDATPLDPSDSSGGFGQINLTVPESGDTRGLMGQPLVLTDGALGETTGTIRNIGGNGLSARLVANSRLANLAVERTIQPFVGTLTDCLEYHFSLCGITTGLVIDPVFDAITVQVPGGRENVHDRIRQMAAAYDFEVSLVSNNVVVRKPRERLAINYRNAEVSWEMSQDQFAQTVSGYYYNTYSGTHIAYPLHGDSTASADLEVFQVDADYEIQLDASLSSFEQPVPSTGQDYLSDDLSRYAISTMEGDTILPYTWQKYGGLLEVTLSEDTRSLSVRVRGARIPSLAPFRIAYRDSTGAFRSAIRIRGTGVFWIREKMTLTIHDNPDLAPDEVGADVDVQFMETKDQLYHRLLRTAERYGTDMQTISVRTGGINRLGESGSARYATIGDVAAAYPGAATIGDLHAALGPTIGDWNETMLALVSSEFTNQAFGNVAGARVRHDHSYYRIKTATITANEISYSAERDNTIADVYHYGETIAQWNARWAGKTIRDVNIAPLIEEDAL